ncbi:MAG: gamma carbonic anhydrase family protein [Desulfobacteraceae bacterium]|nr:gamma carbonic anhydrase family protein [Desulfobacteraceae bacterium]
MLYEFRGIRPKTGKNTYVSETATIIGSVEIGDNCYIGHGAILRGDYGKILIGDGTAVEEGVIIHSPPGETNDIGKKVTLGHGAILHGKKIGDYAVVGMGAVLSILSEVGERAIIAEGAVVKMRQIVPEKKIYAGNPAVYVRDLQTRDIEMWDFGKQLYIDLAKEYLENGMKPVL